MDAPKIRTYSRRKPIISYKTSSALVPSYPDPQMNIRESRLNDKTLIIDSFNDTFDKILTEEKLKSKQQKKLENDESFKKPLFDKLEKKKRKRRQEKLDDEENLDNENINKPSKKKRQKNPVIKDKIKKPKQKVAMNMKKKVLLKGLENLNLKECTVNLDKFSTGYNLCNSQELLENNNKQISLKNGEFVKSNDLNNFSHHLRPSDNLLSSTPRDHKPRMVLNVQNLSPISLHRDNRNALKKSVYVLSHGEKSEQSNVDKELSLHNEKHNSFERINIVKPKKSILKTTSSIQRNTFENNAQEIVTGEQNKIAEEIADADKNNCSVSEILDSKKLHNSNDNINSHESLNPSAKVPITQPNTNKESLDITTKTSDKVNKLENFIDSPLLFDDSVDLMKLTHKVNTEIMQMVESRALQKSVHQELDLDKVNTKSRIGNTVINESSFIPDDWTNDYTSTYEYGLHTEDNENITENVELNKESVINIKDDIAKAENISSKLLAELKKMDKSKSNPLKNVEDEEEANALLQNSKNNETVIENSEAIDQTITEETVQEFQEINKLDDTTYIESTTNYRKTRSNERGGIKRKLDQIKEYSILNGKEPIIHIKKLDDLSLKRRKINKKSMSKNTRKVSVSNEIIAENNDDNISEIETNSFKTGDKIDINENNLQPLIKISRIENQNLTDLSSVSLQIVEKLKKKLQKAKVQTSKREEQTKENPIVNKINDSVLNEDIDSSNDKSQDFNTLVLKLKDSAKITMRRKTVKKWTKPLAAITEDQVDESSTSLNNKEANDKVTENVNVEMKRTSSNKSLNDDFLAEENEINKSACGRQSQPVYLKPGKSWTRSLSIINHFHDLNRQNLEELAVGRGKNWRHSVQSVLDMQPEGTLHNVSNNDEETDFHLHSLSTKVPARRETNPFSLVTMSPPRGVSRFSMRIIPDGKRSTFTNDFVDSQRSSSISNRTRQTSLSRKASLKIRRDILIQTEEDLIKSAKDIILKRCKQNSYLPFDVCFPDSYIDNCCKIGEGVYGEVFFHQSDEGGKSVIKIIPIEGDELVNCEPQKKFHEILSEIIIAEELYKLRFGDSCNTNGFVGVNKIMCVTGKYPQKMIDLWNIYDIKKKSENDCPSMFKDGQLYIIFELAHGGQDLEAFVFKNASESFSIFLQTAFTLAVAEISLEFEHRDLHWGNILISKTSETESSYKLHDNEFSLPTNGVKVSVIDFTLSRMSYQGCKIFNDLATDPSLFQAQGEYQFEIYRLMRNAVNNDWQQFNPYTNVLWLDYTLDKMIAGANYKKKTTKIHKTAIQQMKDLRKEILNYKSAYDFVNNCSTVADIINI